MARTIVVQEWTESEAGWGQRPDGCSLHLSDADREAFIKSYWDGMPDRSEGVPECYSFPSGNAYLADVDPDIYRKVSESDQGIWSMSVPRKR